MNEEMLQLLLQLLASQDSKGLTTSNKGLDTVNDFSRLLASPELGLATDTYDPMLAVQQAPAPYVDSAALTQQYMATGGVMGEVASGIAAGQLNGVQAKARLLQAIEAGDPEVSGLDEKVLFDTVDSIEQEVAQNNANRTRYEAEAAQAQQEGNVYTEAGYANPLESYYAGTNGAGQFEFNVPISEDLAKWYGASQVNAQRSAESLGKYAKENRGFRLDAGQSAREADAIRKSNAGLNYIMKEAVDPNRRAPGAQTVNGFQTLREDPIEVSRGSKPKTKEDPMLKEAARWNAMALANDAKVQRDSNMGTAKTLRKQAKTTAQRQGQAEGAIAFQAWIAQQQGRTPQKDQQGARAQALMSLLLGQ